MRLIMKRCMHLMDGWMICDFTSFSTVLQSYQDDGRMIMKGCVQWNPVYCCLQRELNQVLLGQLARPNSEAPLLLFICETM